MNIIDVINKTKRSVPLTQEEISYLVTDYTNGKIPDYQMSAWLMAVCLNGLTDEETFALTMAMRDSGKVLHLDIPLTVDKHSTGGVGDKTSLVIGPIVAACGVCAAKMSGRGLGHTGGTIDKLESINGFRTDLPLEEFQSVLKQTGFSIISQSDELCPADKKIYADCLILDVKYGSGAFMKTSEDAKKLGELMERIGTFAGKKCKAVITDMNTPLGSNIGNALEVKEAVETLQGKVKGRFYDVCIELATDMLEIAGKGTNNECRAMAEEAVSSGKALDVLRKTIRLQGGDERICDDVSLLPRPEFHYEVRATEDMDIVSFNTEELGMTSLLLGAGRTEKGDRIDPSAGIVMNCSPGDTLSEGDVIMTLYSSFCSDFSNAAVRALNAVEFRSIGVRSYT